MFSRVPTCSETEYLQSLALTAEHAPAPPVGWVDLDAFPKGHPLHGVFSYRRKGDSLTVLFTAALEVDGKVWVHVSMSRPSRMPSYEDVCDVKRLFIGPDKKALQVFAAEADHVNIHEYCLHLFHSPDGDGVPNFGRFGTI